MADLSVRLAWASNITRTARAALTRLADVDHATVSGAPNREDEDGVNVNTATAAALVDCGYAERVEGGIAITREGLIKIGRIHISRSERRQRAAAESSRGPGERRVEAGAWRQANAD